MIHEPRTHHLKTWQGFYGAVLDGSKRFEIRRDDRGFMVGDLLVLQEYDVDRNEPTGRECRVRITYYLPGGEFGFGVQDGFCALGIEPVTT